jgi:AraC family transcriptional regulator
MNINEASRQEYMARINRVTNYVDSHIDGALNLSTLAEVAHFSPFHFHRIFTVMTGETPNDYVLRLRLEKAARLLQNDKKISIAEIAADCGFGSVSLFSRSFRAHFGCTATEYRLREKPIFVNNGVRYSKNGQVLSKIGKQGFDFDAQLCSVKLNNLIFMETKIAIKELPEVKVAYVRYAGPYNQISQAYEKLMRWAGPRGLLSAETKTITIYQDDPAVTEMDKVRQDACITLGTADEVKVEGEVGKATIAGGKYAVGRFQVDSLGFQKAWNTMCLWITDSGYQFSGSPYELYYNSAEEAMQGKFDVDICIPVKPL